MLKLGAIAVLLSPAVCASGYVLPVPSKGAYVGIWANPALGPNPEAAIEAREGPATATRLHITDDVAWCILPNTGANGGSFIGDVDAQLKTFLSTASWPEGDLFPQYLNDVTIHKRLPRR